MDKAKLEQELSAWKRRLAANEKNNLQAGVDKAKKEIARIEAELASATEKKTFPVKEPKKKVKKAKQPKMKKEELEKPASYIVVPDCDELTKKYKEQARKRKEAAKKRVQKSPAEQIVDKVEKTAESIETKAEKLEEQDKGLPSGAVDEIESKMTSFIDSIQSVIKNEADRKEFIKSLIEKLQKML